MFCRTTARAGGDKEGLTPMPNFCQHLGGSGPGPSLDPDLERARVKREGWRSGQSESSAWPAHLKRGPGESRETVGGERRGRWGVEGRVHTSGPDQGPRNGSQLRCPCRTSPVWGWRRSGHRSEAGFMQPGRSRGHKRPGRWTGAEHTWGKKYVLCSYEYICIQLRLTLHFRHHHPCCHHETPSDACPTLC